MLIELAQRRLSRTWALHKREAAAELGKDLHRAGHRVKTAELLLSVAKQKSSSSILPSSAQQMYFKWKCPQRERVQQQQGRDTAAGRDDKECASPIQLPCDTNAFSSSYTAGAVASSHALLSTLYPFIKPPVSRPDWSVQLLGRQFVSFSLLSRRTKASESSSQVDDYMGRRKKSKGRR